MHALHHLIREINKTHRGLGPLVAINILGAKAKRCILNVSPAGCGKSSATDTVHGILRGNSRRYTSLTLASLHRLKGEFSSFTGHLIIDDLGGEKSLWSRLSTVTVLANLVHTHYVKKLTMTYQIEIEDFKGSASLNIQPVLLNSMVQSEDWIAVVRDKVLRYYHLIRPTAPKPTPPTPETRGCDMYNRLRVLTQLVKPTCHAALNLAGNRMGDTNNASQTTDKFWKAVVSTGSHWINAMVTCTVLGTPAITTESMCIVRRKRRRTLIRLSLTYQTPISDAVREACYQHVWLRVRQMVRKQPILRAGRTGKSPPMHTGHSMRRLQNPTRNSNKPNRTNAQVGKS